MTLKSRIFCHQTARASWTWKFWTPNNPSLLFSLPKCNHREKSLLYNVGEKLDRSLGSQKERNWLLSEEGAFLTLVCCPSWSLDQQNSRDLQRHKILHSHRCLVSMSKLQSHLWLLYGKPLSDSALVVLESTCDRFLQRPEYNYF